MKAPDNGRPFVHEMLSSSENPGAEIFTDSFSVTHHGIIHTHLDAIETARNGIFARGILIDIPELRGVPYLEPGEAIYPEDLDAWEKKTGARVRSGDVVFIRTGHWARRVDEGPWSMAERAGLHATSVAWLHKRDISILGSDASSDVRPSQVEGIAQPVHTLVIVAMGTPIFDNCDLEQLSRETRMRKRWDFLLTTSPLTVPGATGSPLNPIAVF